MSEVTMFQPVIAWLKSHQWDVYQERKVKAELNGAFGHTWKPDLIAVKVESIAVFEGGLKLTAEKIAQAFKWKPFAHYVYLVCEYPGEPGPCRPGAGEKQRTPEHEILARAAKANRIGLLYVKPDGSVIVASIAGKNTDPDIDPICDSLARGMTLDEKAGTPSPRGRRYAERADHWSRLGELVAREPGIRWTDAARDLELDKAERTEGLRLLTRGEMPNVTCNPRQSPLELYPKGSETT